MDGVATKTCSKCRRDLPLDEFYIKDKKTGRRYAHCRECHCGITNAYYDQNKEKHNALVRRWQRDHPERMREINHASKERHRETIRARERERTKTPEYQAKKRAYRESRRAERSAYGRWYRDVYREAIAATHAAYRAQNTDACRMRERQSRLKRPDYYKAKNARWKRANRHLVVLQSQRRRARVLANGGNVTAFEWDRIKALCNWTCLMCGRREPDIVLCLDHVVPIALGGWHIPSNIQPLCRSCNSKKHVRVMDLRPY